MIYVGDALDTLRGLERGSAQVLLTDPPYCSGGFTETQRQQSRGMTQAQWFSSDAMGTQGLLWLLRSVLVEALRIGCHDMLVFCDWRMVPALAPALESSGVRYRGMLVWDKESFGCGAGFAPQHEIILHFSDGPRSYATMAGNVLRCKRVARGAAEHPTQKPVELLDKLLNVVATPGEVVLDPFAGSGSTGVAAVARGLGFIGVERDPVYAMIAATRTGLPLRA